MTSQEATARVARGAALLDEKRPGWAGFVNVHSLQLSSCTACVLGQLYGDEVERDTKTAYATGFGFGCWALGIEPPDYGFARYESDPNTADTWESLTNAWIEAIAERVTAAPVVEWTHRETVEAN